jgi:tetratricopeptide (TPR) repeat protein
MRAQPAATTVKRWRKLAAPILALTLLAVALGVPVWADDSPEALLKAGHTDEAIALLKDRVKTAPNDAAAYNLLSRAYIVLERWDDAVTAGEKAVSLEPNVSAYHMWLGRAYGAKAEHSIFITAMRTAKRTRAEFQRAVELQSDNLYAQTDLAEFLIEAPGFLGGGKDKAAEQASKVAALDQPTAHWIQARIAEKEGRNDDAELEYKAAIAGSKIKAPYWLNLASFYRRTHRLNEMEQAINKAVDAERSHDDIFFEAAEMLVKTGRNFPVAAQLLRKYLVSNDKVEQAPTFQAHYLLGSVLEKMGDAQAAAIEYRAALSLAREYEPAQDALKRLSP